MAYEIGDFKDVVFRDVCTSLNILAQFCAKIYEKELQAEDAKDKLIISDKNGTPANHDQKVPRNKRLAPMRKNTNRKVQFRDGEEKSLPENDEEPANHEYVHKIRRLAWKRKNTDKNEQTEDEADNLLSENDEELHKNKKLARKRENTNKKRILESETCEKKGRGANKRTKPEPVTNRPDLPEAFLNKIKEITNKTDIERADVKLLIQKTLSWTDCSDHHSRVTMPQGQIMHKDFLTEEEKGFLQEKKLPNEKRKCFQVKIVVPSLKEWEVKLGMWKITNWTYVLHGPAWKDIVSENNLNESTRVQVWAYRYVGENNENKLCIALVDLDMEERRRLEEEEERRNNFIGNICPVLEQSEDYAELKAGDNVGVERLMPEQFQLSVKVA